MFKVGMMVRQNGFKARQNSHSRAYWAGRGLNMDAWQESGAHLKIVGVGDTTVQARFVRNGTVEAESCVEYMYHPSELSLVPASELHFSDTRTRELFKHADKVVVLQDVPARFAENSSMRRWRAQGTVLKVVRVDTNDGSVSVREMGCTGTPYYFGIEELRFATDVEIATAIQKLAEHKTPAPTTATGRAVSLPQMQELPPLAAPVPGIVQPEYKKEIKIKGSLGGHAVIQWYNDGRPVLELGGERLVLAEEGTLQLLRVLEADRVMAQEAVAKRAKPVFKRGDRVKHCTDSQGVVIGAGTPLGGAERVIVLYDHRTELEQSLIENLTDLGESVVI